jgi:uncharacterized membrane protein
MASSSGKPRLIFVDFARGVAVLAMLETHIFNDLLLPVCKKTAWFKVLDFANGLVAPLFIFVSGFVFIIAGQKKQNDFRSFGPALWKLLRRIGFIWIIAYALHLPFHSFKKMLWATTTDGWLRFYQSNVLHCIAVGWLFLLASFMAIRSEHIYRRWLIGCGVTIILVAPLLWDIDFTQTMPAPLAAYMNQQHYSGFPLFPWLSFMLLGAVGAAAYLDAVKVERERAFMKNLALIGAGLLVVSFLVSLLPFNLSYGTSVLRVSPFFFMKRLGFVLLLFTAGWHFSGKFVSDSSFLVEVGRESLLVYVAHLIILYKNVLGETSLAQQYGKTLTPSQCMLAVLALMTVMSLAAIIWGWVKRHSFTAARVATYATSCYLLFKFFTREH